MTLQRSDFQILFQHTFVKDCSYCEKYMPTSCNLFQRDSVCLDFSMFNSSKVILSLKQGFRIYNYTTVWITKCLEWLEFLKVC